MLEERGEGKKDGRREGSKEEKKEGSSGQSVGHHVTHFVKKDAAFAIKEDALLWADVRKEERRRPP